MRYGIGGFYQFEPEGAPVAPSATLVMTYQDEDVVGIAESELAVYRESKETHEFKFIGGVVDSMSNTVTTYMDTLALYTLAPRLPSGQIKLTATPTTLSADDVSISIIVSDTLWNNDGTLVADGTEFTVFADAGFNPYSMS